MIYALSVCIYKLQFTKRKEIHSHSTYTKSALLVRLEIKRGTNDATHGIHVELLMNPIFFYCAWNHIIIFTSCAVVCTVEKRSRKYILVLFVNEL